MGNTLMNEAVASFGQVPEAEARTDDGFGMYRVRWALIRKPYALKDKRFVFVIHNRAGRHGQLRDVTAETAKSFARKPSLAEREADFERIKGKRA